MKNKTCTRCGISKPFSLMIKHKRCKDGISGTCKECHNNQCIEWQKNNKEKVLLAKNKYYQNNRDKYRNYKKTYAESKKIKLPIIFCLKCNTQFIQKRVTTKYCSVFCYRYIQNKNMRLNLGRNYIKKLLSLGSIQFTGFNNFPDIIEAKRMQLKIHRYLKENK